MMSFEGWLNYIQNAQKTSIDTEKVRKIFYKFSDGAEMMEEYNVDTLVLMRRAWKKNEIVSFSDGTIQDLFNWDIELGDSFPSMNEKQYFLKESDNTVHFHLHK